MWGLTVGEVGDHASYMHSEAWSSGATSNLVMTRLSEDSKSIDDKLFTHRQASHLQKTEVSPEAHSHLGRSSIPTVAVTIIERCELKMDDACSNGLKFCMGETHTDLSGPNVAISDQV